MDIEYQQKYLQLQSTCKKQQKMISKLQLQIRERCQSYLLHSSRYKKMQNNDEQTYGDNSCTSSPSIKVTNMEESIVDTVDWVIKTQDQNLMKRSFSCESAVSKKIPENFTISSQINIFEKFQNEQKENKEQRVNHQQVVAGFKQRIIKIQQEKNKHVKDIQKLNQQLNICRKKVVQLQKKIEASAKQQKKIKSKIQQFSQIQAKISLIYQSLVEKTASMLKAEEIEDPNAQKLSYKLEEIQKLVKLSFFSEKMPEQPTNQVKTQQIQGQYIQNMRIKIPQVIPKQYKQEESQCFKQIRLFSPHQILEIMIKPNQELTKAQRKPQLQRLQQIFQEQILEMSKKHKLHLENTQLQIKWCLQAEMLKKIQQFNAQTSQLKRQLEEGKSSLQELKQQYSQIQQQNLSLISDNMEKSNKISNLELLLQKIRRQSEQMSLERSKLKEHLDSLKLIQSDYDQTKIQLDKSRSIIDDLQSSKLIHQSKNMKQLAQSRATQKNQSLNNSSFKIVQKLQEPYYVQEQLQNDSNHEYVKRSFIRKKIVRRNLSATAYRVVSKSKQQVNDIIKSKISQCTDKSLQKSKKLKESAKKQQVKSTLKDQRISELSEENRDSDYFNNVEQVVKVIEVTTKTPREQIVTTKISSKNVDENKSFRRKL